MRVTEGFLLREIMGDYFLVPQGERALEFSGMMITNGVGACIWKALQEDTTIDELVAKVLVEFDIDEQSARADTEEFLKRLQTCGLLTLEEKC